MSAGDPLGRSNADGLIANVETALLAAWTTAGQPAGALHFPNTDEAPPAAGLWARLTWIGADAVPLTMGASPRDLAGPAAFDEGALVLMAEVYGPAGTGTGAMRRAVDVLRQPLRRARFTATATDGRVTEATVERLGLPRYQDPDADGPGAAWAKFTFAATFSVIEPV